MVRERAILSRLFLFHHTVKATAKFNKKKVIYCQETQ